MVGLSKKIFLTASTVIPVPGVGESRGLFRLGLPVSFSRTRFRWLGVGARFYKFFVKNF